jgi:hypothetical protein
VNRTIQTVEDVLRLLDTMFDAKADRWTDRGGAGWWDRFYDDRDSGVPFFWPAPDESLVTWHDEDRVRDWRRPIWTDQRRRGWPL